jgi:hypothetical protein
MDVTLKEESCTRIVLCVGTDKQTITTCSFLLGSYLILCHGLSLADVSSAFQSVAHRFERFKERTSSEAEEITIFDCWEALHCGKLQGWLDFVSETPDVDRCIDMEEYMHYDSAANGKLHVIIPSRLIAFPCPSDLEVDEASGEAPQWVDIAGERHFGPDYYADVLGDFDVQLVVRCDASATYDDDAFASRGMAVERLGGDLELRPQRLLQEVDRFLTLARLVPGMMGMHGADAGLGSGGEMLVSSLLIKRHGFRARSALAWLRITHPPAGPHHMLSYTVLPRAPTVPGLLPRRHSISDAADAAARPATPSRAQAAAYEDPTPVGGGGGGGGSMRRCASAPAALDRAAVAPPPDAAVGGVAGPTASVSAPAVFDLLGVMG